MTALPELLIARSLGSVLWRAARWRAGLGRFGEVTAHAGKAGGDHAVARSQRGCVPVLAAAENAGS